MISGLAVYDIWVVIVYKRAKQFLLLLLSMVVIIIIPVGVTVCDLPLYKLVLPRLTLKNTAVTKLCLLFGDRIR